MNDGTEAQAMTLPMIPSLSRNESLRLHEDWWGKCRTCRFWSTQDLERMKPGTCVNPKSEMYGKETWTEGYCIKWDSFDPDVALEVISDTYESPWKEPQK